MKRVGFTLVEVLVAIFILGIGATALSQFFIYQTTLHSRMGRIAVVENILSRRAEEVLAMPARLASDTNFIIPWRDTVFQLRQDVIDSTESISLGFGGFPPNTTEEKLWAKRPREVRLEVRLGTNDNDRSGEILGQLFFVVGGTGREED